jgi:hypothetical protein
MPARGSRELILDPNTEAIVCRGEDDVTNLRGGPQPLA